MPAYSTMRMPVQRTDVAPDGSDVRVLLHLDGGGVGHFELGPNRISTAGRHRTVDEIWFFLGGRGEMWRRHGDEEQIVSVDAGTCLTIPVGTEFQFRSFGFEPLAALGVTMPPWPGGDEWVPVEGCAAWRR
jgi:mannose-6-phosphate isomerase-like protein (cupin superfamily)